MRNAGRRAVRCSSVSRTTARHVEYRPRVELAGIRAKPHNHLSDFVRQAEPLHWTVVDHSCDNIGFKNSVSCLCRSARGLRSYARI